MPKVFPIHDLFIKQLATVEGPNVVRWLALQDTDHLLRRFGQAEVVRASGGRSTSLRVREVADETWAIIEGRVEFVWHDLRSSSPTYNCWYNLECDHPTLLLVPFGVAFGYRVVDGPATMLRVTTHADGEHDGDQDLPWDSKR